MATRLLLVLVILLASACAAPAATPTATPTVEASAQAVTPPAPTATTAPSPTPPPTSKPLPTIAPQPSPTPTLTPTPRPAIGLIALKDQALRLINGERAAAGVPALTMGSNAAAQVHALDMLTNRYLSHWGRDGFNPYMRFTRASGVNIMSENIYGTYRLLPQAPEEPVYPLDEVLAAHEHFMAEPLQRANVLNPQYRRVSIGLVCDEAACAIVHHYEGAFVSFQSVPAMTGSGRLAMSGTILGGIETLDIAAVWYDRTPQELTYGQLGVSAGYTVGEKPVAFLRPPPGGGFYYEDSSVPYSWFSSVNPLDVSPEVPRPVYCVFCIQIAPNYIQHQREVPWVEASVWSALGPTFTVQAELGEIVAEHGPGVYTIVLWGNLGEEPVAISNYSVFVR